MASSPAPTDRNGLSEALPSHPVMVKEEIADLISQYMRHIMSVWSIWNGLINKP
jgi:hypothetical protein